MLVAFRFKNYGSFKDEMVLDLRAIKSYKEHPYNLITKNKENPLLKVIAVYGANASGKSTFVNAYSAFLRIVRRSFRPNDAENSDSILNKCYYPFLLDEDSINEGTEFEGIYHHNGYEYRYGYIYNDKSIQYEWLYRKSMATNRLVRILERGPEKIDLGASVKKACEKYLPDIAEDVLALSFFSSLKLRTQVFVEAISCILAILPVSLAHDRLTEFFIKDYFEKDFSETERPRLLAFLKAIDVGIRDIRVEKNKNTLLVFTKHIGKDNNPCEFLLDLESDGTRRAIAIYSLMRQALLHGKGLIIDEFNSQLHPLLQKYIVDRFYQSDNCAQLIYTTHDTLLLDKQYMRRDQIWFTSKNEDGESSLFSLAEFKIRNDQSFGKDYLGGVFGAIPILKNFSFEEVKDGQ